jgi:hypothetical protein
MRIPKRSKDGYYIVEDRPLVSVTTALDIVDTGIGEWKAKVGTKEAGKISRTATTLGKQVHKIPEADIKRTELKLPKKPSQGLLNCQTAYHRWREEHHTEQLLLAEEFVYSLTQGYAGTADAVGVDAVYDFKTSKRISPLYWLQLAAYAAAIMERAAKSGRYLPITRPVIVRLDPETGDYAHYEREYTEDLANTFYAALRLWRYYNITEKENEDDDYGRAIASRELEPNRSGNSEEGSEQAVAGSEDSDDRAGEIWQV